MKCLYIYVLTVAVISAGVPKDLCDTCVPTQDCPLFKNLNITEQLIWMEKFPCGSLAEVDDLEVPAGFASAAKGDYVCCANNIWGVEKPEHFRPRMGYGSRTQSRFSTPNNKDHDNIIKSPSTGPGNNNYFNENPNDRPNNNNNNPYDNRPSNEDFNNYYYNKYRKPKIYNNANNNKIDPSNHNVGDYDQNTNNNYDPNQFASNNSSTVWFPDRSRNYDNTDYWQTHNPDRSQKPSENEAIPPTQYYPPENGANPSISNNPPSNIIRLPIQYDPSENYGRLPNQYNPPGNDVRPPIQYDPPGSGKNSPISSNPPSNVIRLPIQYDPPRNDDRQPNQINPPGNGARPPIQYDPPGNEVRQPNQLNPPGNEAGPPTHSTPPGNEENIPDTNDPPPNIVIPPVQYDPSGNMARPPIQNMPPGYGMARPPQYYYPDYLGTPNQHYYPDNLGTPQHYYPDHSGTPNQHYYPDNSGTPNQHYYPDNSGTPNQHFYPDNSGTPQHFYPDNSGTPQHYYPDHSGPPNQYFYPDNSGRFNQHYYPDNSGKPNQYYPPENMGRPPYSQPENNNYMPGDPYAKNPWESNHNDQRNRRRINDYDYDNPYYDDYPYDYIDQDNNVGNAGGQCRLTSFPPDPQSDCCGRQLADDDRITGWNNKPRTSSWAKPSSRPRWTRSISGNDDNVTVEIENRIAGGHATELYQYPWTVLLLTTFDYGRTEASFNCGGGLISARYVLTAGHCVYDKGGSVKSVQVTLAEYDKNSFPKDCKATRDGRKCIENIRMYAEEVITHPSYENENLVNDIALLRVRGSAPYTEYIRPICLPTINIDEPQFSNLQFDVAGWGRIGTYTSSIKQSTVLHLVNHNQCQKYYPQLTNKHLCAAGKRGEDTCKGDSGGPLMVLYRGRYYVAGIVSGKRADSPCGTTVPSLYTNVYHYVDWIRRNIRN